MYKRINDKTMQHLEFLFANAIEQGKYTYTEFDKFLNDTLCYGAVVMEKIIVGSVEEDDLTDVEEIIIINKENMFSLN